jgi:hypothetical protein
MHCDEVQDHLVELLYNEGVIPPEIQAHISECSVCTQELENMKQTRKHLQAWKDESPAGMMILNHAASQKRVAGWKYLRYAALAAMVLLCFMALANTRITWNKDGFSFSTHLFARPETERNYYTKTELRTLMIQALDDTEDRMNETNYQMLLKMMDTVEQDRWADLNLTRNGTVRNRNSY